MAYGFDERRHYEKLHERYKNYFPSLIDGYISSYPEDYIQYIELKKRFDTTPNLAELRKNSLTAEAHTAEQEKRYSDAEKLWLQIAAICHQTNAAYHEKDAYLVEHRALQCRHMQIYKDAYISIRSFADVPNLDKLQDALTDAAAKSLKKKDYSSFTVYKLLNARLCHANGKERDAFLLEESARPYGFFDDYFVPPGEGSKNPPVEEMFLQMVAANYKSELYPK